MIDIKCVPVSKFEKKASNASLNFLRKNDERGLKQRMYGSLLTYISISTCHKSYIKKMTRKMWLLTITTNDSYFSAPFLILKKGHFHNID